jgi:hypothetical protein
VKFSLAHRTNPTEGVCLYDFIHSELCYFFFKCTRHALLLALRLLLDLFLLGAALPFTCVTNDVCNFRRRLRGTYCMHGGVSVIRVRVHPTRHFRPPGFIV